MYYIAFQSSILSGIKAEKNKELQIKNVFATSIHNGEGPLHFFIFLEVLYQRSEVPLSPFP